ncbi:beta/gamma crystallin family protein [Pendulispora rubella]|uniref:Beta/gamma crystallin family protein n=1 Tax=Pendulispora rubella TaxID=2741070 RepID=A0ABZ2L7N8_9BACT
MNAKNQALGVVLGAVFAMIVPGCSEGAEVAEQDTTNATSDEVTIQQTEFRTYDLTNYGGTNEGIGGASGCNNLGSTAGLVSSLKIKDGNYKFYARNDCQGGFLGLTGPRDIANLADFGWDNRIRSVKVTGSCETCR